MDILLENPLATMYGPYFLVFYGLMIFFSVIVLAVVKSQIDRTNNLPLPPIPAQIDPFEIAYLRGGTNEVARSVVFALMQKNFIEITDKDGKTVINRTNPAAKSGNLNQIEELALNWFGGSREPKDVFDSNGLIKQLEGFGQMYQSRLERGQMLTGVETRAAFAPVKWTAYLIIFGLGAYKIIAAIAHGRFNIIFLVIFGIVGLLIAKAFANLPRLTKLGKAYLARLQLAFDNLKYEAQKAYIPSNESKPAPQLRHQASFAGVDPLLLSVGVFGSGILAGTVFDNYNQTFQKAQQNAAASSSCGSDCGSSCSSGDSGGSSCSSGSSCGSGCGGGCGGCS